MADETPDSGDAAGSDDTEGTADVTIEAAEVDIDGDGIVDAVVVRTTAAIDVDGDGVVDAVEVIEAVGVDVNQDGELSEDEVAVTETLYVRDGLLEEGEGEGSES